MAFAFIYRVLVVPLLDVLLIGFLNETVQIFSWSVELSSSSELNGNVTILEVNEQHIYSDSV